jgi:hypothetical protein
LSLPKTIVMTLPSNVLKQLETPEWQSQSTALHEASSLSEMVCIGLQLGLMLARWLLEEALERRAQAPLEWSNCPSCGQRLTSKGWQSRQLQTLVGRIT